MLIVTFLCIILIFYGNKVVCVISITIFLQLFLALFLQLYAMICDFDAIVWDLNAMLWNLNNMIWDLNCCKRTGVSWLYMLILFVLYLRELKLCEDLESPRYKYWQSTNHWTPMTECTMALSTAQLKPSLNSQAGQLRSTKVCKL